MPDSKTFQRLVAAPLSNRAERRRAERLRSASIVRRRSRGLGFEFLEDRRLLASLTLGASQDNTLYKADEGASNGSGNYIFAGSSGNSAVRRTVLAFDLASTGIPVDATIHDVALELTVTRTSSAVDTDVAIHRLTSDWGEGTTVAPGTESQGGPANSADATWSHRFFDTTPWTTPGGDFVATASAMATVGAVGTSPRWSSPAMRADVTAWLEDPSANFGWILVGDEVTPGTVRRFDSKDLSGDMSPQLSIKYFETDHYLTVSIDAASVDENGGATSVIVTRSQTVGDLVVDLSSSDVGEATVGASVTIPDGQATSGPISIVAANDALTDGTQSVTITAAATGYESDSDSVEVADDETTLVLISDGKLVIEDIAGGTTADTLTIATDGSDLLISDGNNSIATDIQAAGGAGTNELRVPLSAFSGQLMLDTKQGDDTVTLAATLGTALAEGLMFSGGAGEDALIVAGAGFNLRLAQLTTVDRVDIRGAGNNSLEVDLASAQANLDGTADSLSLQSDRGDSFVFDEGWAVPDTMVVDGAFVRVAQQATATLHIQGPSDWQNPVQPLDVTGDNDIVPRDALLIINELNQPVFTVTEGVLVDAAAVDPFPLAFFDVVGNGFAAPSDAIRVIDFLNERARAQCVQVRSCTRAQGEGEAIGRATDLSQRLRQMDASPLHEGAYAEAWHRAAPLGSTEDASHKSRGTDEVAHLHISTISAPTPRPAHSGRESSPRPPTWSITALHQLLAQQDSWLEKAFPESGTGYSN